MFISPNSSTVASRRIAVIVRLLAGALLTAVAIGSGGCSSAVGGKERLSSSMAPAAAPTQITSSNARTVSPPLAATQPEVTNAHDDAVRRVAAIELGPVIAASMPVVPPSAPREPVDPGAQKLVHSIVSVLGDRQLAIDGVTNISVSGIRNLSRSHADEFSAFVGRFSDALTRAGRSDRLAFTNDAGVPAAYRMQGTAYMINADGFDQWELYLTLTPTDRDFDIWEAGSAVRVLRIPRPGVAQIAYTGK